MRSNRTDKTELILWALLLLPLLWFAAALAQVAEQAHGLAEITALLSELIQNPAALHWCPNTPKFLLAVLVIYPLAVYCYKLDQADRRPGEEHGSAHWGSVRQLNAKYQNRKDKVQNYIFSQNIRFSTDSHAHRHNLNVVVIGIYFSTRRNYRRREEHGSAKWGNAKAVDKKYRQNPPSENKLMTQAVRIGLNGKKHRRNLNTLVCGGSGAGKTRFYCKPNLMQANTSFVILDPNGKEVLGYILQAVH